MAVRAWRTSATQLTTSSAAVADPSGVRSQIMIFNEVGSGVVVRVYRMFYWLMFVNTAEVIASLSVRRISGYAPAPYGTINALVTSPVQWFIPPLAREPNASLTPKITIMSNVIVTVSGTMRSILQPSGPPRLTKATWSNWYCDLQSALVWSSGEDGVLEPLVLREGEGVDIAADNSAAQASQGNAEIEFTVEG